MISREYITVRCRSSGGAPTSLNVQLSMIVLSCAIGRATRMANRGFGGVQGPALQQFYESGGPRSMQMSLRLEF